MKLIRFGERGAELPGILDEAGKRYDLSSVFNDWDRDFFNNNGIDKLTQHLAENLTLPEVADNKRWAAPIARPGKVICIGLNYSDHAAESGMEVPIEPIVFMKGSNTVVGPYDPIIIPRKSVKTDWEVELGVVIAKDVKYLKSRDEADGYIAGYCTVNDVSEREFQLERGGQWTKGKSADNFTPTGPYLLTKEEVADVNNLDLTLHVNGELMQNGNTKNLIFDVYYIVHYLSQFMTLEAGDLILTGTPAGVGLGMTPPCYFKAGDKVILEVQGLGEQQQICENA